MSIQTKITQYISNNVLTLYIIAIIVPLGAFIFHIVENFDWLFNPLFNTPPDFMFYFNGIIVIVALFAWYRLTRFYFELGSIEYLLLAYFCFGIALWQLSNQMWYINLSPAFSYFVDQNPEFWRIYPEWIIYRQPFWWGGILIFIHAIRLRGWDSFNRPMKGLIIILLVDSILSNPIMDISTHIVAWQTQNLNISFYENLWYLKHSIALAISWWYGPFIDSILMYIIVIYAYMTMKPSRINKSIKISKIGWISFAIIQITYFIVWATDIVVNAIPDINEALWDFLAVLNGLSLILIMMLLLLVPEALLISKYQLFKATKLYSFVDTVPGQKSEHLLPLNLLSYKSRLRDYILSLPLDTQKEIGIVSAKREND